MGELRRSRNVRPGPRKARVVDRDLLVLEALGRMKLASSVILTKLFFREPSLTSRRVAKLASLRLVNVFAPALDRPNLIGLSDRGLERLVEGGADPTELHVARNPGPNGGEHLGMINEVRVALVLTCRAHPDVKIEFFRADHDLRRESELAVPSYLPDALIRLSTPRGPVGLVLEADTGQESARYVVTKKVAVLAESLRRSLPVWGLAPPWRPLLVANSAMRLARVAALARGVPSEERWLATTVEHLSAVGALGPVALSFPSLRAESAQRSFRGRCTLTGEPPVVP